MYGRTDLGDYFRGDLSLRQLYVRILALPLDAPLSILLEQQREAAEQAREALADEAALAPFKRG